MHGPCVPHQVMWWSDHVLGPCIPHQVPRYADQLFCHQVLLSILSLLTDPNPDSPLVGEIARVRGWRAILITIKLYYVSVMGGACGLRD
jgi:hypothetical protein